ncbi:MAG TPA: N-acetylmuramoyl-L-alanine amidase [Coleofasciculaceae cyanobacterium]
MRYRLLPSCLLPGLLGTFGILLLSSPAQAGRLQSWQFDPHGNRLTLTTDEGVQPRVQLVSNPTRLVIDLPGTTLGRSRITQPIGGGIQEIRIGQFNAGTTRIVVELDAGYVIEPSQVQVHSNNAAEWTVQLPALQQGIASNSEPLPIPVSGNPGRLPSIVQAQAVDASTVLEGVRITPDGFFFQTSGKKPDIAQNYSDDRRQLVLELKDSAISPRLSQREIGVNRYRVNQIQLMQAEDGNSPVVRITLNLTGDSPEWQATVANLGGIVLVPIGGIAAATPNNRTSQSLTPLPTSQANSQQAPPNRDTPATPGRLPNASIDLPNVSNRRIRIAIDPGHGGRDPGAVGINGLQEKIVVLDIAQRVSELLEQQGAQVILTRSNDSEIDLEPRVQDANRGNANLFVSIHANSIDLDHPGTNGVETYYYSSDAARQLAQAIQTSLTQATGMRSIGVKQARFYVLRNTHMPAALVEVGFVTGRDDAPRLADPQFRDRMAEGIARGILQYVQQRL